MSKYYGDDVDTSLLDAKVLKGVEDVRNRGEEWKSVHSSIKCTGTSFRYVRREMEEDGEEALVICNTCNECEIIGVREITPTGYEWYVVREQPLN